MTKRTNTSRSTPSRSSASLKQLLVDWRRRARESQFAHYEAVKPLVRANYALGVAAVTLSTFAGTSLFATLEAQSGPEFRLLIAFVSVLAAVLSSLQTFLRYSERAEKHRGTAARFSSLRREIEFLQASGAPYDKERIEAVREKMDAIAAEAPEIPARVFKKVEELLKERKS